jgi:hypothetical protein
MPISRSILYFHTRFLGNFFSYLLLFNVYFFQQYLNFQVGYPQFLLFDPEKNHPFYKKPFFSSENHLSQNKTAFASKKKSADPKNNA